MTTSRYVSLDWDALNFAADLDTMRRNTETIFNHPNRTAVSIIPLLCDMEEETQHHLNIDPRHLSDSITTLIHAWQAPW